MHTTDSFSSNKNKKERWLRFGLAAIGISIVDAYPVVAGASPSNELTGTQTIEPRKDIFGRNLIMGVDSPPPIHLLNANPDYELRKKYNLNFINMSYAFGESDAEEDKKKRYGDGTLLYWVSKLKYLSINELPLEEGIAVLVAKNISEDKAQYLEYGSANKQWLFLRRAYTSSTDGILCLRYIDPISKKITEERASWESDSGDTVIVGVVVGSVKELPRHVLPVKKLG